MIVVATILVVAILSIFLFGKKDKTDDSSKGESQEDIEARETIESVTDGYKKRAEEAKDSGESITNTISYAHMLASQNRHSEALAQLLNAESKFSREDVEKTDLYFQISGVYEQLNKIDEATEYKKKYIDLLRSTGRGDTADYLENPPEDT